MKKLIIKLSKLINVIIKGNDKYMNKKNLIFFIIAGRDIIANTLLKYNLGSILQFYIAVQNKYIKFNEIH